MYVALFLQSMVQIRGQNVCSRTKLLLGVELPGLAWTCLDLPGAPWTCLDLPGPAWTCLEMHRAAEYGMWFGHGMDLVEA